MSLDNQLPEFGKKLARAALNLNKEFSRPLTALITPLEELSANESDPHRLEQLNLALNNAYRFHSLFKLLEEIAEVEAGTADFSFHQSDVISFARNLVNSFDQVAKNKNIDLQFRASYAELNCLYDYRKLRRILYSLLANAIRYSDKSDSEITVSVQMLTGTRFLLITIADNGIGIQPDKLPHLTNPFYEDPLHLKLYQSTSLGLYLVQRLLDLLGGKLAFYSKKEAGTIVEVQFPIYQQLDEIPYKRYSVANELVPELLQLHEHIREVDTYEIVDVDPTNSPEIPLLLVLHTDESLPDLLLRALKDKYRVLLANHPGKAMQMAMDHLPDLIFVATAWTDYTQATIHFLKQSGLCAHIPIYWLAAAATVEERKSAHHLLVDGISAAQATAEDIIDEVDKIIRNRRLAYAYSAKKSLHQVARHEKELNMADSFLLRLHHVVDKHLDDDNPDMDQLSDLLHMSRTQLHRKIKALSGLSTTNYIREYKLKLAYADIQKGMGTMAELADKYGFGSLAYFSRSFKRAFGITPSEARSLK